MSVIYFSGICVLFFRLLFSITRIIHIKNNSETIYFGKVKILKTDSTIPYSFFKTIFLPKDERNQMIIEHELAHVKQFHWFDLSLAEIASVLLWFNPFVVLYKRSLKLQHEYLADSYVIKNNCRLENYLDCMFKRVQKVSFGGPVSYFYCKTIKKRIVMITKNKTSIKFLGIYLLVLPLVFMLTLAFSGPGKDGNWNVITNSEVKPLDNITSIHPVDIKKVTAINGYGERIHPKSKERVFHHAIDFALPEGENIVSAAEGTVAEASYDTKTGNYILINHDEVYSTFYSHLKSILVKSGDKVEKGQVIGYVGNTGYSTGPHLHYEVHKSGERVDPNLYLPK